MDNIFKRFTCLFLALLMILEVFSPVTALAAGLVDDTNYENSNSNKIEKKISDELFNKPAEKTSQKDTRKTNSNKKEEVHKNSSNKPKETGKAPELIPAKKTKNDYEFFENTKKNEPDQAKAKEKAKAEAEAKAAEEAKAKEEQAAKENAELEKQKQELLRIEAEKQAQAARANEAEAAAAEAEYRDARQKRIELEKLLEEKLKEKGLRDQQKQESEKSLNQEKSNKLEDKNKTEDLTEDEEEKGLLEKIKEGLGLTDLQKADKELKKALKNKDNGLEEIQALLDTFEDKYDLSREDQAKLMEDNTEAFREFIERHGYENFDPQMFMIQNDAAAEEDGLEISDLYENLMNENRELTEEELEAGLTFYQMPTVSGKDEEGFGFFRSAFRAVGAGNQGNLNLDGKKFTIITRYDISNKNGSVQKGQSFTIHLDEKLTVKDESTLPSIKYNNEVIATPKYTSNNTITYTLTRNIDQNIQVPINIPVDYNIGKITLDDDGTFTVINKVTGIGVDNPPKDLVPQKVDKNGNPAGSIIEPGREDVTQIVDSSRNYKLDIDSVGNPVIKNGEMVGINWVVKIESDKDLKKELGMKMNFTLVEGSGLKEIESITSSDATEVIQDNAIKRQTGIVDSKHSTINQSTHSYMYSIYTPISNKQAAYVLDISTILTKDDNYVGAVRSVMDKGYPKDKVEQHTPTRVGINNRTTIEGKFLSNTLGQWTITDGVCTLDNNNGLPLETRTLEGANIKTGKRVVYGVDPATGKMVVKEQEKGLTDIPAKEADPNTSQAVGNIGVYQFTHDVDNTNTPNSYKISGVKISKFQDLYIDQEWNLPADSMKMPAQTFIAKDDAGTQIAEKHVEEGAEGENQRLVVVPDARYWNIADNGTANKVGHKISQEFDKPTVTASDGKTYKYNENANYYKGDTNTQFIHNSAIPETNLKPVSFTVVKVDSKDPSKKLAGATFKLLGDNQPSIVTDSEGKATFSNVLPGPYTLIEEKAPAGYKLDQSQKTITISNDGKISVNGSNIQSSGSTSATKLVRHDSAPNWPDYMNAMHYGKINDNGELEFYLYLKPESDNGAGGTNRDTRLNISIPGVDITDVTAYDVSPGYRQNVRNSMEQQKSDGYIPLLGNNVINAANNNKITGTAKTTDPYTGKTGYQIYFPEARFANDWGFLVKVKANVGDKQSVSLDYDWLTNENTANQTKLTQNVILNKKSGGEGQENQILVKNEEFTKSPISVTKFGDEFDNDGNRNKLKGAEFVLKDSKGNVIANKFTDENGTADFGQFPVGRYRLEEAQAPGGYQKNGVYFEVVVDDQGQVTYTARFEDGIGTPEAGRDYYIEKGEETGNSAKATVTSVNQRLEYLENEPGDIGTKTGVWEAYSYESLKYHADVTLTNVSEGSRFEIQFDRNLDFTQYFSKFPKIVIDGKEVADPYFDYNTNLLTYVFNDKLEKNKTTVTASINLRGIIPDKYYAKETGQYPFTIKVAPGQTVKQITGNPNLTEKINADYGQHHSTTGDSNQSYYFRDVYQKEDGEWYVTVLTYLNPLGLGYSTKTVKYNWLTTDFQGNKRIAEWSGKGYDPLYDLNDVKVYATDEATYVSDNGVKLNRYMPLSMGIRPEQEPNIYNLLAHQVINPNQKTDSGKNGVYITYNPDKITRTGKIDSTFPLIVKVPKPTNKGGYVVEQTFKINDIEKFNTKWRAFYMNDGNLTSAFASKANVNTAIGDQAGGEIPKYYKEIVGLINNKYTPGSFKITKYDETNQGNKLPNATFALTDENGKTIYRTSNANGEVDFTNIAPGRYSLEETSAPEGYQLTNKKWQVIVLSDGSVRIRETSITGAGQLYTGNEINIPVSNRQSGKEFRVYKKDGDGRPLPGAKFKITSPGDKNFLLEAESDENGIVSFNGNLEKDKNYILEEDEPPVGYNPLNKKWVLRVEDGKTKVYNYSDPTEEATVEKSLLGDAGTEWVDVKNRDTSNWSDYDNRWTGWAGNNQNAQYLGTRIIAINKNAGYAIQRYVINPEARNIGKTTASIHRQSVYDNNMDWFDINKFDEKKDIKVYKLDKSVTELISDIRYANYKPEDITKSVIKTAKEEDGRYGEPKRLHLDIPSTDKPIIIDIKVPYKNKDGGVGTGMDWTNGNQIYWKADYYERVSDIKTAGLVSATGGTIVGSYVAEGSLDVTNDLKTYEFKIQKVKEGETTTAVPGAVFKLTGPEPLKDERFETTNKDGMLSFSRLEPGKYTLVEEKPAPGYEKSNTTWTIRVTKDGKVYIKDNKPTTDTTESTGSPISTFSIVNLGSEDTAEALSINPELTKEIQRVKASTYNFTNESVGNSPLFLNEADKRENSVINKIDAIYGENNFEKLFTAGITLREVAMASYDPNIIGEKSEATVVDGDGFEISPETIPEAQRAGNAVTYDIINTISDVGKKYVKVSTNAKYLGNDEFLVRIDVNGNVNKDYSDVTFDLQLHDDVSFVPNSTITWKLNANDKNQVPNNPSRWHTGYNPNTKKIGVPNGVISINKGDTASMEFKVKMKSNLSINQTGYIINSLKVYNLDCNKLAAKKMEAYNIHQNAQNGTVITDPLNYQRNGQPVTFTAKPNPGYRLVGNVTVTNDNTGRDVPIRNGNTFTMPASDVTINARFEAETYSISYTQPNGGRVSGQNSAKTGDTVTVTTTPEKGYKFDKLIVTGPNGQPINTNSNQFTMTAGNVNVSASFTKSAYKIGYQTPQHGTVQVPETANPGDTVTITATPDSGYMVDTIKVNSGQGKVDVTGNAFVMPASDVVVDVTFKLKPADKYNVEVEQTANGSVTAEPTSQEAGKTVNLTVTPEKGYKLETLTVKDSNGQTVQVNNNSFTMPKGDVKIIAAFVEDPDVMGYKVNISENIENGSVTASPTSAKKGETVTITARANDGFELSSIKVTDGEGKPVTVTNNSFTMPEGQVTVSAIFNPVDMGEEIKPGQAAQITNKQVGLDLKIYKKDRYDRKLEGAIFTIRKTDENYKTIDNEFGVKTGTSNAEGLVEFKHENGNPIRLPEGYYLIEETAAPLGYRKANAPWKIEVVEENGQLVAKYKGPKETPQSFVEKNDNLDIKEANGVKYATKITHIDTESRTFIQRVYIDTRGKNGVVNVQINPKHKREEIDRAGLPPVTIKEGVKTAYRSTYKITGINGDPSEAQMIKILNDYDVSNPNVTVVNTARWRPFDWGFDEDQLNLEPGVYYIDIEGFYDTSIIDRNVTNEVAIDSNYNFTQKDGVTQSTKPVLKDPYVNNNKTELPDADLGKIDIDIEFFDGAREFKQLYNNNGTIEYRAIKDENGKDEASYQDGVVAIKQWLEKYYNKEYAKSWFESKKAGQKYINQLSKEIEYPTWYNNQWYMVSNKSGVVTPPVTPGQQGYKAPSSTINTSMDISSLYSSSATNTVPQEGLSVVNDEERYNITFSKHGKNSDTDSIEEITKRRLEGAVFKLEKRVREGIYEEVEGSYVSSAFNGYFGFRGLEPGRYRLIEVQAPKGYKPIDGPLLHFSVETVSIVSKRITDPRTGENIDINTVEFYFPGNNTAYKFEDLEMRDPVTDKVIKFKDAKNADLETTRIINPLDKSKEVPLRDLSIKFPGEIKDKQGNVIKDTYKLSEIQITPTSNGYISLEYDKANGVYQYIPEKSTTEENGLLVDYVTSATAKNMGKIVNEKPGKGSLTINKVDEHGNALKGTANEKGELIAGAKFRLTNLTDGSSPVEKTVGTDGKLTFEGLKIGNYKLEEIESPDGHINTKQVWHFTVGGEGLDPYSGDIARTGQDLSDKITLETTEMKVLNPKYKIPTKDGEIHPHYGESMEFTNKFKLAENTKINPGDYFVINVSDNIDLHGIFENSISSLDIFADGVGTIAKADYNREAGTLTYTFTKYADTYTLIDFSNKLTAFIDLYEVKKSDTGLGGQKVGFGIREDTSQYKDIKVIYDLNMEKDNNSIDYLNMTSKIVKYNQETGEFLHYFYINRDKENSRTNYFYYIPSLDVENVVITKYRLNNNSNVENDMPESFGVNENSSNIRRSGYGVSRQSMAKGELLELPFENGMSSRDSYIVKVTGRVSGKDKSSYQAESVLQTYNNYSGKLFVDRFDGVYGFRNESTADAKLSIQAVNPSNIIKFKKINGNGDALKDATFQLFKKDNKGNWNSHGQPITTGEDGLIEYPKLPKGEYQLKETTAPKGYVAPDGPLAEFKVDESGKVFRKEVYKDKKGQTQEKYVEEPGVVPIDLINNKDNEIVFKKVDGKDSTIVLEGAEFQVLYKQDKDAEYPKDSIKLYKDNAGTIYAFKADEASSGYTEVEGNKLTSGKDGLVKFKVRSNGYYALKEVKAPAGYINPRGIVKEFVVKDGKIQTEKYKTEMDVKKTTGFSMANDVFQKSYATNMILRFNPNHEDITYVKDKSTIKLSDLPLKAEIWDNKFNAKEPISITAYLVDGDNKETTTKTYTLDLTRDYGTNLKASKTIDLYSLVKELEKQTADGDIKSNKTIVLSMSTSLYLTSELDIKSNIVIGDKINENRTFHIGTKGDEYVDHSYKFTTMVEIGTGSDAATNPIEIENKKGEYPLTGGRGTLIFTLAGLVLMSAAAYVYSRKRGVSYDE